MPRLAHVHVLVCLLVLVSGTAWFTLDELLAETPAFTEHAAAAQADTAVIHDFYGAINMALSTGLPPNFTSILANDFVAHLDPPGLPPTRDGLVAHLQALGSTFPGVQLLPLNLSTDGDRIVAEVSVESDTMGSFLGLPMAGALVAWGPVDVFRIADGLIVEMRGGRADVPLLQPLVDLPLEVPVSSLQSVALGRVTVDAGSDFPAGSVLGSEALHVEDGQVTVEIAENVGSLVRRSLSSHVIDAGNRQLIRPGERAVLVAGDVLLLPQGAQAMLRNDGTTAAEVLKVAVREPGGPNRVPGPEGTAQEAPSASDAPGVTVTDLGPQPVLALPNGLAQLGLGRVTLAQGAALPISTTGATLLVIEDGSLSTTNVVGTVWSRSGGDGSITTATGTTYGPGDGILFEPGATGEVFSVAGQPLVLLVVTITPALPESGL